MQVQKARFGTILKSLEVSKDEVRLRRVSDVVKLLSPIVLDLESIRGNDKESFDEVVIAILDFCENAIDWSDEQQLEKRFLVASFYHRLLTLRVSGETQVRLKEQIEKNIILLWGTGARDLDLDDAFQCWFATAHQLPDMNCLILEPFYKEDDEGNFSKKVFLVPRGRAARILHKKSKLTSKERGDLDALQQQDISDLEEQYHLKQEKLALDHAQQQAKVQDQVNLLATELAGLDQNPETLALEAEWKVIADKQESSLSRLESWFNEMTAKISHEFKTTDIRLIDNQTKQYELHQSRVRHEDSILAKKIEELKQICATKLDEIGNVSLPSQLIHRAENNKKKVMAQESCALAINKAVADSRIRQRKIDSDIEALRNKTQQGRDAAERKKSRQMEAVRDGRRQKLEAIMKAFGQQREPLNLEMNRADDTRRDLSKKISDVKKTLESQPDEIQVLAEEFADLVALRRPARKDVTWKDFPAYEGFVSDGWLHGRAPKAAAIEE